MTTSQATATQTDSREQPAPKNLQDALAGAHTQSGVSLLDLSKKSPLLVVLLRHLGCTFCREALADLKERRAELEQSGVQIVLVQMAPDSEAAPVFTRYGLGDVHRVSDPDKHLYRAFELKRGRLGQLFGFKVWIRFLIAGVIKRHGAGKLAGDGLQMPGAFLVADGRIVRAFRHRSAADRPDYTDLAGCSGGACAAP